MSEPVRRSPLHGRGEIAGPAGDRMVERPFLGKIAVRADPESAGERLGSLVGVELPEACRAAVAGDVAVLWIGPDEFWVVTPPNAEIDLAARLEGALEGVTHQVAVVSDYYTVIELAGPNSRRILMKLSTLDLHPRAFTVGHAAGSMFGRTQATLWQADEEGPAFRLLVRWSTADYLWCLLAECGREFGLPAQEPVGGETWRLAR